MMNPEHKVVGVEREHAHKAMLAACNLGELTLECLDMFHPKMKLTPETFTVLSKSIVQRMLREQASINEVSEFLKTEPTT